MEEKVKKQNEIVFSKKMLEEQVSLQPYIKVIM